MTSIFLHDPSDLEAPVEGGVQLCSREFLSIVERASSVTTQVPVHRDLRLTSRLRRKLGATYSLYDVRQLRELIACIDSRAVSHLFINRAELIRFAPIAKQVLPGIRVVLMSHGSQSGDDLYELSGRGGLRRRGFKHGFGAWKLGRDIVFESISRRNYVDLTCVMSQQESVLEQWLGSRKVIVLPRIVVTQPVRWQPAARRFGFVGTLDHSPTRIALEQVFEELSRIGQNWTCRVTGSPAIIGTSLARRFPMVQYLGALTDSELRQESATWRFMIHPVFWLARGASMKFGTALNWQIPVLTTEFGARGYEWHIGNIQFAESDPVAFAQRIVHLLSDDDALLQMQSNVVQASQSSPDVEILAARLRDAIR